ncbi:two-component regulator propeller domain-containing protein, partial [Longispora fulva]
MMKLKFLLYGMIIFMVMGRGNSQELPLTHFTSVSEVNPLPSALVTQVYQDKEGFIWFSNFSSGVVRHDGVGMDLYDQEDGLRDHNVWQLIEDANGYLWVSSNSGLVVSEEPLPAYRNGKRVHFTANPAEVSLTDEAIFHNQQMAADTSGNLYVGTASSGILRY